MATAKINNTRKYKNVPNTKKLKKYFPEYWTVHRFAITDTDSDVYTW